MTTPDPIPAAVRATAYLRPSRWRRRPVGMVRYDAWWPDGRVTFDVDWVGGLRYRRAPADFEPVARAVHGTCPEVGVGRWVDRWGGVVDGPAEEPAGPGDRGGRPRRRRAPDGHEGVGRGVLARAVGGAAGLAVGVPLVLGALGDGVTGPVGVVGCLGGLALLAGLLPGRRGG